MQGNLHSDAPDYSRRPLSPDRVRAIEQFAGRSILDIGCGNGSYVLHYADRYAIRGIDYQPFGAWQRRPDLFSISDAVKLDLPDSSVDTILSFETLEHLREPQAALTEYFRVCRRNLILTVPNCALTSGMRASGVIYNHWIDRTHANFWELGSISALMQAAGFRIVTAELINRIFLGPLVAESIGLSGIVARAFSRLHRLVPGPKYHMTCLVVGEKPEVVARGCA